MSTPVYLVDAFASKPGTGNPAGVVVLEEPAPHEWMRAIGAELNQPATAFVSPAPGDTFDLRWMTAVGELELCGHGTLAAAHVLRETSAVSGSRVSFNTRGGVLRAELTGEAITLDFPILQPHPAEPPDDLIRAIADSAPTSVHRTNLDFVAELRSEDEVRHAAPDLEALRAVPARGLILTAKGDHGGHDFVSRFFAPSTGIPEDSVTGSAHCALAAYWIPRLGRPELTGYQASSRGGWVRVSMPQPGRVGIEGRAVTVLTGTLR